MSSDKNDKQFTEDGQELGDMFIAKKDGLLSTILYDEDYEVIGYYSTLFHDYASIVKKQNK